MTESANDRRIQSDATAAQTIFTYDFKIRAASELVVERRAVADDTVTVLVEGSGNDYTVTGVGDAGGGTVVLTSGATENDQYTIEGVTAVDRGTDFVDDLEASDLNANFDEIYRLINELQREVERSIRMPMSDDDSDVLGTDMILGLAVDRASKSLQFDADGKVTFSATAPDVTGPSSSTDNAIARFDGTTGKIIQGSSVIIDDSNNVSGIGTLAAGAPTFTGGLTGTTGAFSGALSATTGTFTGVVTAAQGTAAAPGYTFTSDADTGIYRSAANALGVTIGGAAIVDFTHGAGTTERLDVARASGAVSITAAGVTNAHVDIAGVGTGSVRLGDAQLVFPDADGSNGQTMVTDGAGNLSFSAAGSGDVVGPASATDNAIARFDTTTGKLLQDSAVTIDDSGNVAGVGTLTATGVVTIPAGTVAAPSVSFSGDADTGLYRPAANQLGIAAGGDEVAVFIGGTSTTSFAQLTAGTTTVDLAAAGDETNIDLDLSPKGSGNVEVQSGQMLVPNGAASTPGFAFSADPDTGFQGATGVINVQLGGSTSVVFNSQGVRIGAGSAASPALFFDGDTNTGVYKGAAPDSVGIAGGGNEIAEFIGGAAHTGYWQFTSGIGALTLDATGDATDIDIILDPKGAGQLKLRNPRMEHEFTAAVTLAQGELCYLNSSGEMAKTDADAESTADTLLGIALEAITATNIGNFLLYGEYDETDLVTTAGAIQYVSTTEGAITETAPSATGDIVRSVGYALSTTVLFFDPDRSWVEIV